MLFGIAIHQKPLSFYRQILINVTPSENKEFIKRKNKQRIETNILQYDFKKYFCFLNIINDYGDYIHCFIFFDTQLALEACSRKKNKIFEALNLYLYNTEVVLYPQKNVRKNVSLVKYLFYRAFNMPCRSIETVIFAV